MQPQTRARLPRSAPWLLLAALSITLVGTALAVRPHAQGTPAVLLLSSDAVVIAAGTGQARITATVRDADGAPLAGVPVAFSGERGSVGPAQAGTDSAGVAASVFTAGSAPGRGRVVATAGGLSQEVIVQITGPDGPERQSFELDPAPRTLKPGQQIPIIVVLTDAAGSPLSGEPVTLFGSRGELSPASAVTDAQGRVSATFTAGQAAGEARITALATRASASTTLTIEGNGSQPPPVPSPSPTTDPAVYLPLVRS